MNQEQYDRLYGDEFHRQMMELKQFILERSRPSYLIATTDTTNYEVYAEKAAPADTCAHDAPLLKVTDGIAYCDGCGRSFELREFGT